MADTSSPIPSGADDQALPFSAEDWGKTPESVKQHVLNLCKIISEHLKTVADLRDKVEKLEARLNQNSSNSNRPPSSDSPYQKEKATESKKKGKSGRKKGRKGSRQKLLSATETREIPPERCECGCTDFKRLEPTTRTSTLSFPRS